jgi:hypothetical protein
MPESPLFGWLSDEVERRTSLSRLEARGTVRLVLKEAGLDPSALDAKQLGVVLARLMPDALKKRGVADADVVCRRLGDALQMALPTLVETKDAAYGVFERLGRDPKGKKP